MAAEPRRLLVIAPDDFDRDSFNALPGYRFTFMPAWTDHWRPSPGFDTLGYWHRCRQRLHETPFDGVVTTHDLSDFICALLAQEFDLPGANPEAVFRCLHKTYTRQFQPDPVPFQTLALDADAGAGISYPCFVKPPWLKLSLLSFRVDNAKQMQTVLNKARKEIPKWSPIYYPIFEFGLDMATYPLATVDHLLIEPCIEAPQVTVEILVNRGKPTLWAITDTNAYPDQPRVFDNFSLPSRHSDAIQAKLWARSCELIKTIGFDHGLCNAEFWIDGDDCRLIEINGRSAASFDGLYTHCLDVSVFEAIAALGCADTPPLPRPNGTVGGQFNIISFASAPARELLDFDVADQIPECFIFVAPDDPVQAQSDLGSVLGQIELFGDDYNTIHRQAEAIRARLLKQPQHSPWAQLKA